MTEFSVVQTRFESIPHETLIGVLTSQGGMTHPDAAYAVRRHHGILWDHFGHTQAEAVCRELIDLGFGVSCCALGGNSAIGRTKTNRWFELDADEIRIPVGIRGETISVPWPSVFVISLNQIAEVSKHPISERPRVAGSSLTSFAIAHNTTPQYQTRSKLADVLDLICIDQNGSVHYLRLPSKELAFERIMGEGTNLSRFDRFLVVVDYCVTHSVNAVISPETRKALVQRQEHHSEVEGDAMQVIQEETIDIPKSLVAFSSDLSYAAGNANGKRLNTNRNLQRC